MVQYWTSQLFFKVKKNSLHTIVFQFYRESNMYHNQSKVETHIEGYVTMNRCSAIYQLRYRSGCISQ